MAADAGDTDWAQIAAPLRRLPAFVPTPVVELNRAVAVAMADGPAAGLPIVEALAQPDALRRLPPAAGGPRRSAAPPRRWDEAADAYRDALALVDNDAERRFLQRRLDEVLAMQAWLLTSISSAASPPPIAGWRSSPRPGPTARCSPRSSTPASSIIPSTGEPVVGFVAGGALKLRLLRARPVGPRSRSAPAGSGSPSRDRSA